MILQWNWRRWLGGQQKTARRRSQPVVAAQVLESRRLLAAIGNLTLLNTAGALSLSSTDINDVEVSIYRSGTSVVFEGGRNTTITLGTSVRATQTISLATANSLTLNLGRGISKVSVEGLSLTGDLRLNNGTNGVTGSSIVTVNAGATNTSIGGSIVANLGSTNSIFNLYGSRNFGGNMTVGGSVQITQAGAGDKQVNLAGPLANNPSGGRLTINGDVNVLDTGNGYSGLHVDAGVTIGGGLSFDNSLNTVNGNAIEILSNSQSFGTTSIAKTLTLKTSKALYEGSTVQIEAIGTPLAVGGIATIATGSGADVVELRNTRFVNTLALNVGSSPDYARDLMQIDGSTFTLGVTLTSSGSEARLNIGTDLAYAPTVFNSTLSVYMNGPAAEIYLSNAGASVPMFVAKSNLSLIGGTPAGTYYVQGPISVVSTKFTRSNFNTTPPVIASPLVRASLANGVLTIASTDAQDPAVTVRRSGTRVVIEGRNGTRVAYGTSTATSQSILLSTVSGLILNLGTGINDVQVTGLNISGNLTINQTSGQSLVSINAIPGNTTISGQVQANLQNSKATLNIFGSTDFGGNLTINGGLNVTAASAGTVQVNLAGPLAGNPNGGLLAIKQGVTFNSTGKGDSGLHIDAGVTITGNVLFDNSLNDVGSSLFELLSSPGIFGETSVSGTLTVKTSQSPYGLDEVDILAINAPLTVGGAVAITGGRGPDEVLLQNVLFNSTTLIDVGDSPAYSPNVVTIDAGTFQGAFTHSSTGNRSRLNLGTDASFLPTYFNNTLTASMTGPSAEILVSNPFSLQTQVFFARLVTLTGGTPNGTFLLNGLYSLSPLNLRTTRFDVVNQFN